MNHDSHPIQPQAKEEASTALDIAVTFGPENLSDARLLAALMDGDREEVAEALLQDAGSLARIHAMGPLELLALGLSHAEVTRLHLLGEFFVRSMRSRHRSLGNLQEFAEAVMGRAAAHRWTQEHVGLTGVDGHNRVILERILFSGTRYEVLVGIPTIMRESLRSGCEGIVLYRWQPGPRAEVTRADLTICDEIRVVASILRIRVIDYLVISEQECASASIGQQWLD